MGAVGFILNTTVQGGWRLQEGHEEKFEGQFSMGPASLGRLQLQQEHPQVIFQLKIGVIYLLFFKSFFYLKAEKLRDLFMPRE